MKQKNIISEKSGFTVPVKSGFSAFGPVKIYYPDKTPFYIYPEARKITFNLPPGKYYTENNLQRLNAPVAFKFPARRKRERFMKLPKNVTVLYGDNPNKASIFLNRGLILIDNQFKNADPFTTKFIIYHEIGHYFYKTEEFCDEYAQERLLNEGYNLSQIRSASYNALNKDNPRQHLCEHKLKTSIKK